MNIHIICNLARLGISGVVVCVVIFLSPDGNVPACGLPPLLRRRGKDDIVAELIDPIAGLQLFVALLRRYGDVLVTGEVHDRFWGKVDLDRGILCDLDIVQPYITCFVVFFGVVIRRLSFPVNCNHNILHKIPFRRRCADRYLTVQINVAVLATGTGAVTLNGSSGENGHVDLNQCQCGYP